MSKRLREEDLSGASSVEELCQSVKRLQTVGPEGYLSVTDQNHDPYCQPPVPEKHSFEQHAQQQQHQQTQQQQQQPTRRQSLSNIQDGALPAQAHYCQDSEWQYENTNLMLRDLHLERIQRQGGGNF